MEGWQPTPGNCYADCMVLLEAVYHKHGGTLCHGYPRLAAACGAVPAGTPYGHAWLEVPLDGLPWPVCVDHMHPTTPVPMPTFYTAGRIDPAWVRRYTLAEARRAMLEHEHYGPWHDGPPGAV